MLATKPHFYPIMPDVEYESRIEKMARYTRTALSMPPLAAGLTIVAACEFYKRYVLEGHYRLARRVFRRRRQDVLHREVQAYLKGVMP